MLTVELRNLVSCCRRCFAAPSQPPAHLRQLRVAHQRTLRNTPDEHLSLPDLPDLNSGPLAHDRVP